MGVSVCVERAGMKGKCHEMRKVRSIFVNHFPHKCGVM